jgi:hypothetical protein
MEAGIGRRCAGLFRIHLAGLMLVVAVGAVLCWAWLYNRQYASIERSWVSIHLHDLHHDDAAQRRRGAENLGQAEAADLTRVVPALALAVDDPDWQVRRGAVTSLAKVIRRHARNAQRDSIDEIRLAMRVLVPALDDRRTEVRIAAMGSVAELGDLFRAPPVGVGLSDAASVVVPEARRITDALSRAMRDTDAEVRAAALRPLGRIGPLAGLVPDQIENAAENDPAIEVRTAARAALYLGWPEHVRDVPVLAA